MRHDHMSSWVLLAQLLCAQMCTTWGFATLPMCHHHGATDCCCVPFKGQGLEMSRCGRATVYTHGNELAGWQWWSWWGGACVCDVGAFPAGVTLMASQCVTWCVQSECYMCLDDVTTQLCIRHSSSVP